MRIKKYPKEKEEQFIYTIGCHAKRSWRTKEREDGTLGFFDSVDNRLLGYETKDGNYVLVYDE